jgi:hypothetical protein
LCSFPDGVTLSISARKRSRRASFFLAANSLSAEPRVRVWAKEASASIETDQRHLYKLPTEALRATPEFIWQAVQRFIAGESSPQFGPSTDFDLIVSHHRFPPKPVFGKALSMASGGKEVLPKHFTGGEGSPCFRLLRGAEFDVVRKTVLQRCRKYLQNQKKNGLKAPIA